MKLLSVAFIVAFAAVAMGIGWPIVRRFDARRALSGMERAVLAFGIGAMIIHLAVFAVGHFRLDGLSMGLLAATLTAAAVSGLRVVSWRAVMAVAYDRLRWGMPDRLLWVLWVAAVVVAVSSLLQGLAPPNDFDSLMYHMTLPEMDVEQGRISPNYALGMAHAFFPALLENLVRLALATVGADAAQMFSAAFGIAAAFATGALALRAGFTAHMAVLAGLMFLAVRVVIWEMATTEVEVALAAYCAAATLVYAAWRERGGFGLAALFGLMVGGALNVKYMGLPFAAAAAPIALWDMVRQRVRIAEAVLVGTVAVAAFLPHMVRTAVLTGNPVYPLFGWAFGDGENPLMDAMSAYGRGRGILDLVRAPWDIFVFPAHYFDGLIFGAPYLLVYLPLGFWIFCRSGAGRSASVIAGTYFVFWFFLMGQQVRFLIPILPMVCAAAAGGVTALWTAVRDNRILSGAAATMAVVLVVNQAAFVGIYAALRLPPALGLMTPADYHASTPTMQGAFYATCTYVRNHLKSGERYLSLLNNHFYYCPQMSAIRNQTFPDETAFWLSGKPLPPINLETFIHRLEAERIRFVIIQTRYENRRNSTAFAEIRSTHADESRFGRFIVPAVRDLQPLAKDSISAVYDGPEVIARLKALGDDRSRAGSPSPK